MTHRSAPFVAPNLHSPNLMAQTTQIIAIPQHCWLMNPCEKQVKLLLSTLQADIVQFRDNFFRRSISPKFKICLFMQAIWQRCKAMSKPGKLWLTGAKGFYPSAGLPPDYLPLPASPEIPPVYLSCAKPHFLTRTKAKELKILAQWRALVENAVRMRDASWWRWKMP